MGSPTPTLFATATLLAEPHGPPAEQIFFSGADYFVALIRDINAARRQIDLEVYILEFDIVGRAVLAALGHAAQRGVTVRVMVDGIGLTLTDGELLEMVERAGFRFRIYHPIPWFFGHWRYSMGGRALFSQFRDLAARMNHRNHRKVCCVDRHIAWVGSFNLAAVHLPETQGGADWRDTAIRIEGIDTTPLEMAFNRAWNPWSLPPLTRWPRAPFRLNATLRERRRLARNLLGRIRRSQRRIWITNAYFVPDERLLRQLRRAARRGVDVRIILPSRSDIFFMPWTSAVFYASLLEHGVHIHEYQPHVLHAKTIIIDDWMTVGSSNLNSRSLLHDLEVDYVVSGAAPREELERQFRADLAESREIFRSAYPHRPFWQRWLAHLLLTVKYWL